MTYKEIKAHRTHLAANKTPEKKQQYLSKTFNLIQHFQTTQVKKTKWSAKQVNAKTLNLHNKIGEGIIAAVLIGKLAIFKSFNSAECNKPSISTFPSALSNITQINNQIHNHFSYFLKTTDIYIYISTFVTKTALKQSYYYFYQDQRRRVGYQTSLNADYCQAVSLDLQTQI